MRLADRARRTGLRRGQAQLACFERLGAPGWRALVEVCTAAREAGLLVVADGKRGDVPTTAATARRWWERPDALGQVRGLDADAFTANPLLGRMRSALIDAAAGAAPASSCLSAPRTQAPLGSRDAEFEGRPLHELLAGLVAELAPRLAGEGGLSGVGAVVGATAPSTSAGSAS